MPGSRRHRREALHCCPACAASVRGRPQVGRSAPRPWLWVTLLALVAAMIPLAAMEGGEPAVAQAAIASPVPPALEPAPVPDVAEIVPDQPASEKPPAPKKTTTPAVVWRDSRAVGTPNAGSLVNGVRLPASGVGYYTYNPATQQPPGGPDRTWGTARLVREVIDLGRWWARTYPKQPPLGIGDLSRPSGGAFHGPVVGHQSHQNGLDVDIRLVRRDGARAQVDPSQAVVDRLVSRGASLVLIGPNLDLRGPSGVVMPWPAHDDHLHVRFPG